MSNGHIKSQNASETAQGNTVVLAGHIALTLITSATLGFIRSKGRFELSAKLFHP